LPAEGKGGNFLTSRFVGGFVLIIFYVFSNCFARSDRFVLIELPVISSWEACKPWSDRLPQWPGMG
jgi:hypothetical protein